MPGCRGPWSWVPRILRFWVPRSWDIVIWRLTNSGSQVFRSGSLITRFTIQFRSKKVTHFMNLNSFDIKNNRLPQHSQRTFWLYNFSSNHVSIWCQKKILWCTISWRPRTAFLKHFKRKCLYVSKYLLEKIFVSET